MNECNGDTTPAIARLHQMQPLKVQPLPLPYQQPEGSVVAAEGVGNVIPGQAQAHTRVVVVQQPPPQPVPMQTIVIIPNSTPTQMSKVDQQNYLQQQMNMNGGNCWRITLIVMWCLILAGSVVPIPISLSAGLSAPSVLGAIFVGAIEIILDSVVIYGLVKYDYCCCIFGAVWSGLHMLAVLIVLIIAYYVMYIIIFILIYMVCLFSFSVVLVKKIAQVRRYQQR